MWRQKSVGEEPRLRWRERKVDNPIADEVLGTQGHIYPFSQNSWQTRFRFVSQEEDRPYANVHKIVKGFMQKNFEGLDFDVYAQECAKKNIPAQHDFSEVGNEEIVATIRLYEGKHEGIVIDRPYTIDHSTTLRLIYEKYVYSLPLHLWEPQPGLITDTAGANDILRLIGIKYSEVFDRNGNAI